jgi:hypothetical protein
MTLYDFGASLVVLLLVVGSLLFTVLVQPPEPICHQPELTCIGQSITEQPILIKE